MPQEPKKRHSNARQGKRRAHIHLVASTVIKCANCGEAVQSHTVCSNCGFYRGKEVIVKKSKA